MIFDKIANLPFYAAFDKRFLIIDRFLKENDAATLPTGRHELSEGIFANVSEYSPSKELYSFEAHRKYADLQYLVSGSELIQWAPMDELTGAGEYFEEQDFQGTEKTGATLLDLHVTGGSFAYFAPCDLHRPGLYLNCDKVKKIVFKIPV